MAVTTMKRKGRGKAQKTLEVVLHENSPSVGRRQPLLEGQDFSSRGTARRSSCSGTRMAEVAGGTTAECAAVCCCCPFGVINLLLLTVYKLPAGLYRKALRKRRRRKLIKKRNGLPPSGLMSFSPDEPELLFRSSLTPMNMVDDAHKDTDVLALEEEMWGKLYSSGFWRSPSRKSDALHFEIKDTNC